MVNRVTRKQVVSDLNSGVKEYRRSPVGHVRPDGDPLILGPRYSHDLLQILRAAGSKVQFCCSV